MTLDSLVTYASTGFSVVAFISVAQSKPYSWLCVTASLLQQLVLSSQHPWAAAWVSRPSVQALHILAASAGLCTALTLLCQKTRQQHATVIQPSPGPNYTNPQPSQTAGEAQQAGPKQQPDAAAQPDVASPGTPVRAPAPPHVAPLPSLPIASPGSPGPGVLSDDAAPTSLVPAPTRPAPATTTDLTGEAATTTAGTATPSGVQPITDSVGSPAAVAGSTSHGDGGPQSLPEPVFSELLSVLPQRDIRSVREVCRDWRGLASTILTFLQPRALRPQDIARVFPNVTYLDLSKCILGIRPSNLKQLFRQLPQLSSLHLGSGGDTSSAGAWAVTERCLVEVAQARRAVKELCVGQCVHVPDGGMIAAANIKTLHTVILSGCVNVTDVGVLMLATLPSITHVDLSWCIKLSDAGLAGLASHRKQLAYLNASGCPLVTESGLQSLSVLTQLKSLILTHMGLSTAAVTDSALRSWSLMSQLTQLCLGGMQLGHVAISDNTLAELPSHHPELQTLELQFLHNVTDEGLEQLLDPLQHTLRKLVLRSCVGITQGCLPALARLSLLTELEVLGCITVPMSSATLPQLLYTTDTPLGSEVQPEHPTAAAPTETGNFCPPPPPQMPPPPSSSLQEGPPEAAAAKYDVASDGQGIPLLRVFNLTQLRSLTLGSVAPGHQTPSVGLDDHCLRMLTPLGHCLHTLKLITYTGDLTTSAAQLALQSLSRLTALEFLDCRQVLDTGWSTLASSPCMATLERLSISQLSPYCSPPSLRQLVSAASCLTYLTLRSGCNAVDDSVLVAVATQLKHLRTLQIHDARAVTDLGLEALGALKELTGLVLSCCDLVTGVGLSTWAVAGAMQHPAPAATSGSSSTTTTQQALGDQLDRLHYRLLALSLSSGASVCDEALWGLHSVCPLLTRLDLALCGGVTDRGLEALPALTHLTCLDLQQCSRISDTGMGFLAQLPSLATLKLNGCVWVGDAGVAALAALRSVLLTLQLDKCIHITDTGVQSLARITSLTSLRLARCPEITDVGVTSLLALSRLSSLSLELCPRVTAAGLMALASLTTLARLTV